MDPQKHILLFVNNLRGGGGGFRPFIVHFGRKTDFELGVGGEGYFWILGSKFFGSYIKVTVNIRQNKFEVHI